jgi:hypothetical protein
MNRRTIHQLLLLLTLLSVGCTDLGRQDDVPVRAFDAAMWRTGDRRTRGAMVKDLEATRLLIGKNKRQAIDLLGMPDASDTAGHALEYAVDIGLRTGPWGLGGTWLFFTTVVIDSTSAEVTEVRTRD